MTSKPNQFMVTPTGGERAHQSPVFEETPEALMARFQSQGRQDFAAKLLAMMRNQFGGHAVSRSE